MVVSLAFFVEELRNVRGEPIEGVSDDLEPSDCGVVLTGSPGRMRESFEVLAQHKVRKLIISGVYRDAKLHEIFPQLPYYPEVNPGDVILEKISRSTLSNVEQSLVVAQALKCSNILLMTSRLHMYRAYRTFRVLFPSQIAIRKYAIVNPGKEDSLWAIFLETIKSIFYRLLV